MRIARLLVSAAALALTSAAVASAQGGTVKKIPSGTYAMVADSGYAGMEVAGWTLRFEGDTSMVAEAGGAMMVRARVSYEGANIMWSDEEGQMTCEQPAKYSFALSEGDRRVRFTLVDDACEPRAQVLTGVTLVRQP